MSRQIQSRSANVHLRHRFANSRYRPYSSCQRKDDLNLDEDEELSLLLLSMMAMLLLWYHQAYMDIRPPTTSAATAIVHFKYLVGYQDWRFGEIVRMSSCVFQELCSVLREHGFRDSRKGITVEHQIILFIQVGRGKTSRQIATEFRLSKETISRHFNNTLRKLMQVASEFIRLPTNEDILRWPTPREIVVNPKFFPFFKNCLGALDGTHVEAMVPCNDQPRFRNRKGFISQNVLGVCSFDLTFQTVYAGWEGSASDARVLEDAVRKGAFVVPDGHYYLADAGYGLTRQTLTPFRGVRYHLKEWSKGSGREDRKPENAKELFNLRHAMLRNVVERIFGVLKRRFPLLKRMVDYPYRTQVRLVYAFSFLHNFIHRGGRRDWISDSAIETLEEQRGGIGAAYLEENEENMEVPEDNTDAENWRLGIANEMWDSYCAYIRTSTSRT